MKQTIKEIQTQSITDKRELKADGEIGVLVSQNQYFKIAKLCNELKIIRLARKVSLINLAKKIGLHRETISDLENGLTINPKLNTLYRYCQGLDINLSIIIERK